MTDEQKVEKLVEIMHKYLVPQKEHSGMKASDIAREMLEAIK